MNNLQNYEGRQNIFNFLSVQPNDKFETQKEKENKPQKETEIKSKNIQKEHNELSEIKPFEELCSKTMELTSSSKAQFEILQKYFNHLLEDEEECIDNNQNSYEQDKKKISIGLQLKQIRQSMLNNSITYLNKMEEKVKINENRLLTQKREIDNIKKIHKEYSQKLNILKEVVLTHKAE